MNLQEPNSINSLLQKQAVEGALSSHACAWLSGSAWTIVRRFKLSICREANPSKPINCFETQSWRERFKIWREMAVPRSIEDPLRNASCASSRRCNLVSLDFEAGARRIMQEEIGNSLRSSEDFLSWRRRTQPCRNNFYR